MSNLIGQSLGRYHILEQLGEGGMATVYKAFDTRLDTDVAVKVIRTENLTLGTMDRTLKRFEREAKALARLTHPNIVKVMDYGEYEGKPYLVTPYLPGGTLKQLLIKPMPWQDAVQLLLPIANALEYAHEHDIIHRDIKPTNILITEKGQPLLSDFGVAKILDAEETMELTGTGVGVGTSEYMAPEQVTSKNADHRVDIYALGIVFYEMVTGRKPYTADTPMAILFKHASEALPRPKSFVPSLPDSVEQVLIKALAKKPEDRYQNMAEFVRAMEILLEGRKAGKRNALPKTKETPAREKHTEVKLPPIPRRTAITIGLITLGIGVIVIFSPSLKTLPASLFPTATASHTPTPESLSTQWLTPTSTHTSTPSQTPTPINTPTATSLPEEFEDTQGVLMRLVPAGDFIMGSNAGDSDERPVHQIYLDTFYIDKYEVTYGMYKTCINTAQCDENFYDDYKNPIFDDYAMTYVTWDMAKTYCEWRGAQLPTEAQWEKAARGTDERTYPWGEGLDCKYAIYFKGCSNYNEDSTLNLQVGRLKDGVSPYGLFDMAGNVKEWVTDWYDANYYISSPSSNPIGPTTGEQKVLRGGSWGGRWGYNASDVRTSNRFLYDPAMTANDIGFRCARSISP